MVYLVWAGVLISVLGLCGVVYSVIAVTRAKRSGMDDTALRALLTRMMPVNLASFLSAMMGLMMVVVGVLLG